MSFKHFYYKAKTDKQEIFESVFEKYYSKGYFGKISKSVIKESQKKWYEKWLLLLEEGDKDSLMLVLENRDNMLSREWFGEIYGENILEASRNDIEEKLNKVFQ